MRVRAFWLGLSLLLPTSAVAQVDWRVSPSTPPVPLTRLASLNLNSALPDGLNLSPKQEAQFTGTGFRDRLSITPRDTVFPGAPLDPLSLSLGAQDPDYDVQYRRDWQAAHSITASGLEVSLTPHAGFGVEDGDPTAEAGATLRIGQGLDRLTQNGQETFGERPRWYLYAASSKRAVGYNFARTRDGDFARSGVSHDTGTFIGDASIGVAYRKGPLQTSFGVVYREIEAKGLRSYQGLTTDVSEGLVAFQLSIRP